MDNSEDEIYPPVRLDHGQMPNNRKSLFVNKVELFHVTFQNVFFCVKEMTVYDLWGILQLKDTLP